MVSVSLAGDQEGAAPLMNPQQIYIAPLRLRGRKEV